MSTNVYKCGSGIKYRCVEYACQWLKPVTGGAMTFCRGGAFSNHKLASFSFHHGRCPGKTRHQLAASSEGAGRNTCAVVDCRKTSQCPSNSCASFCSPAFEPLALISRPSPASSSACSSALLSISSSPLVQQCTDHLTAYWSCLGLNLRL